MVVQGLHLWQTVAVTSVVELTVNYRQRTDPTFFDLLERFRLGRPTVEDIELLNTRVVYPGQPLPPNIRKAAQSAWKAFASCPIHDKHMESVFVDIFTYIDGDIALYKTICLN